MLVHTGSNWKRLSVAGALAYRWDGRRSRFFFHTCPGTYTDRALVPFIRALKRHFRGGRVVVLAVFHQSRDPADWQTRS